MATADISAHFSLEFTNTFELLLQSKQHQLAGTYMTGSHTGEGAQAVKQYGEVEFEEKTARNADTNFTDIDHQQRWVYPLDYTLALPIDKEDEIRQLGSPQSPYQMAMRAAYNRRLDRTIYESFFADAKTGIRGGDTTQFDATNQEIAVGGAGLTVAKLKEGMEILQENFVDGEEEVYCAITPKQQTNLLNEVEVTNSDYAAVKALVDGKVSKFMGINFIPFAYMNSIPSSLVSGDRHVPLWVKSAIHLGTWNSLEVKIDQRADKNYLTQLYMKTTHGATRLEEKKVVRIICDE